MDINFDNPTEALIACTIILGGFFWMLWAMLSPREAGKPSSERALSESPHIATFRRRKRLFLMVGCLPVLLVISACILHKQLQIPANWAFISVSASIGNGVLMSSILYRCPACNQSVQVRDADGSVIISPDACPHCDEPLA